MKRFQFILISFLLAAALARAQAPNTTTISEAVTNRDIADEGKFRDGLSKVIDGVVDCLNASAWAKKGA